MFPAVTKKLFIPVYREDESYLLPTKKDDDDLCFDFYAAHDAIVKDGDTVAISLGVRMRIPKGFGMFLKERSGWAKRGMIVGGGVIDCGYRGVITALIRYLRPHSNGAPNYLDIKANDKIVQGCIVRNFESELLIVRDIDDFFDGSTRGEGGFGSSGY